MQNLDDVSQKDLRLDQTGFPIFITAVFIEARIRIEDVPRSDRIEFPVSFIFRHNVAYGSPFVSHGDPDFGIVRLFVDRFEIQRQAPPRFIVPPQVIRARVLEQLRRI